MVVVTDVLDGDNVGTATYVDVFVWTDVFVCVSVKENIIESDIVYVCDRTVVLNVTSDGDNVCVLMFVYVWNGTSVSDGVVVCTSWLKLAPAREIPIEKFLINDDDVNVFTFSCVFDIECE